MKLCEISRNVVDASNARTEYDMDERYPGLTGAGLASLLAALPRLRLLIADPHLLKDAILFLHNVNVTSRTFPLQHLYLRLTTKD